MRENVEATGSAGKTKPFNARNGIRVLAGGVFGVLMGIGCVKFALFLQVPVKALLWPDLLAMMLGIVFLGLGIITFLVSLHRGELANNLEGGSAKLPATREEVTSARLQSASFLFAGLMLLLPLAALGTISRISGGELAVFGAVVAFFAAQTVANIMLWQSCDEFLRAQITVSLALAFAIGQGLLFLQAAAEHLHLARPLSSWATINLLLSIYLVAGSWLQLRTRR